MTYCVSARGVGDQGVGGTMGEVSRWSWAAVGMFSGFAGLTVVDQPAILYLMKELFPADEIYFVTVAIQLLAMGITLALSTALGYLSQPERWGRKTVVAVWCFLQALVRRYPSGPAGYRSAQRV